MISLFLAAASFAGPQAASTPPAVHPRLALTMNVKEGGGPEEFMEEVRFQARLGLTGSVASFKWSEVEPPNAEKDLKKITDYVGLITLLGAESAVTIQTIDTNNKTIPSDLTHGWDDPRVLARWDSFLSTVTPLLGPRVKHLSLGNEVDGWLNAHPEEVKAYKVFLEKGRDAVKRIRPDLKVGVTVMAQSYFTNPAWTRDLTSGLDTHFVTYYAIGEDFRVKDPVSIARDLSVLSSFDSARPMVVQEIGMPSSELLGGSEEKQAAFVRQFFKAFSGKGARTPLAAWFMSTDFAPGMVKALEGYYKLELPAFAAYLGTLGLKNHKGEPRQSYRAFIEESKKWIPEP